MQSSGLGNHGAQFEIHDFWFRLSGAAHHWSLVNIQRADVRPKVQYSESRHYNQVTRLD